MQNKDDKHDIINNLQENLIVKTVIAESLHQLTNSNFRFSTMQRITVSPSGRMYTDEINEFVIYTYIKYTTSLKKRVGS